MQTLTPGADKALVTATGLDTTLGVPAPLPAAPEWTSSDGAVLGLAAVIDHPEQVFVLPVGPGTAQLLARSGNLTASLDYTVPGVNPVPVADTLVLDSQIVPQ